MYIVIIKIPQFFLILPPGTHGCSSYESERPRNSSMQVASISPNKWNPDLGALLILTILVTEKINKMLFLICKNLC